MVNAEKWGVKIKSGGDANLPLPNFVRCQPCLSPFQCFQSCVSWTPLCIFSCYVSHAVVSGTYPSEATS